MGLSDNQRVTEQRLQSRGEEFENRMETATSGLNNKDQYALVPRNEDADLLTKTYQSFKLQQEGMTQNEADEFQRMQS